MNDSTARGRVRYFNEGRENVHDDSRSGRRSVINKDLVSAVEEKIQEKRDSPFRHFPYIFQKFHSHFLTAASFYDAGIRDTKTYTSLRQVPQQWWEPCRKVV
jgi:hypothetical protein